MKSLKAAAYFLPPVLSLILYSSLAAMSGMGSVSPGAWIFIVLLFIAAVILIAGKWFGAVLGLSAGLYVIAMSFRYRGQPINLEMPVGIFLLLYYLFCGYLCSKK